MNEPVDTKQRLLEGTLRCLADNGLAATTSRAIAAASGVNLAAITYHFGSKEGLVAHALLETARRWLDPVLTVLRGHAAPEVKLAETARAAASSFDGLRPLLPVYLEALVNAPREPALGDGLKTLMDEVRDSLAQQIGDVQHSHALPGWIDPPSMAVLLVCLANGLALHLALEPSTDMAEVVGQAVRLLLSARADAPPGVTPQP